MNATAIDTSISRYSEEYSPFLSPRRVAEFLGLTISELATLTGLSRNTLSGKVAARKVDAALSPIVRILTMAE